MEYLTPTPTARCVYVPTPVGSPHPPRPLARFPPCASFAPTSTSANERFVRQPLQCPGAGASMSTRSKRAVTHPIAP